METDSVVQPGATLQNTPVPSPLEGGIVISQRPSERGGYSDVYEGIWSHGEEESKVCVKCLRVITSGLPLPHLSDEERLQRRIKRETLIWERARHPNIYPYLGYKVVDEDTWLISPWAENGDLTTYLYKNPNLSYTDKLRLLKDAAKGLAHLHSLVPPIAHGDLSPRNVLIHVIKGVITATLSDFGLSRVMAGFGEHTGLTTAGTNHGTIWYIAKELLSDEAAPTPMSDICALGGVFLFAMSGERPFFKHKTVARVIISIEADQQPRPGDHPDLPENDPLWPLLRQCWKPVPTDRPTAQEVIAKLDELILGN